jgi:membrane protease YdiL (CAAX protease family)
MTARDAVSPEHGSTTAMNERIGHTRFLLLAVVFEGSLVAVAFAIGWSFHIDVLRRLQLSAMSAILGVVGAIPPFALLLATERFQIPALERIKKLLLETLGPSLRACRSYEVVALALVAGIGEEFLFRGAVQPLFERWTASTGWGWLAGLILSNVVFGLLHFITPTYAVLAGLMGVYFGLLLDPTGTPNLLAPILAHGFYDYLAFLVLIRAANSAPDLAKGESGNGRSPDQP